jgi:hypothetical protein
MRHPFTRLLSCVAVAGLASLAAVVIPGGIASASPLTLSCTTLKGTSAAQTLTGCTGTAASQTGSHGSVTVKNNLSTKKGTATVKWATGKTSIESYSFTVLTGTNNKCVARTGYTKVAEAPEKGTVTGGTVTAMKTGAVSGIVCAYSKSGSSTIYVFNMGPIKS